MTQQRRKQIEAQLKKIPDIRYIQAHIVTRDGKMIDLSLFKPQKKRK